jgi:hypothetical protein
LKNLLLPEAGIVQSRNRPDERYDVADLHPDIVRQMMAKVEASMKTFPADILNGWVVTKKLKVRPTPAGALPRSPGTYTGPSRE